MTEVDKVREIAEKYRQWLFSKETDADKAASKEFHLELYNKARGFESGWIHCQTAKDAEIAALKIRCEATEGRRAWFEEIYNAEFKAHLAAVNELKRLREGIQSLQALMDCSSPEDAATALDALIRNFQPSEEPQKPAIGVDENGLPTDDEIHFVAVDESHADRHGWQSLNQKPAYVDGFEDGAKWMKRALQPKGKGEGV